MRMIPFTRGDVLVQFSLFMTSLVNGFSSSSSPSPSSSSNPPQQHSCAVVGVGVLGTSLCRQILETTTDWTVTGITKTTQRHDAIRQAMPADQVHRLTLLTTTTTTSDNDNNNDDTQKFPHVVFCAPPSGSKDYAADVQDAVENLWMGPDGGGNFCFTSSGGIYSVESGIVTEKTPITNVSPRSEKLVKAEEVVTNAGGCVLRLAGLYLLERGAHSYWLGTAGKDKPIQGNPDGLINLLHYDDAAGACWAALRVGPDVCRGQIFLISDGHPQTRRQIVQAALQAAPYRDCPTPTFANEQQPDPTQPGKRYDGTWSNEVLQWKPTYESFDKFMEANA